MKGPYSLIMELAFIEDDHFAVDNLFQIKKNVETTPKMFY